MPIIDVTDWEKENYGTGSREKYVYTHPKTRQKAFFKYPEKDKHTGALAIGEVWSEKLAADIGWVVDVPTPEVAIAKNEEVYGSLSFSFLQDGEQLYHGADFLGAMMSDFDPKKIEQHRLEFIVEIASKFNQVEKIIDILIFDALIGNSDRHSENWGIIFNSNTGEYFLAPAYDNSSSLGREFISDEKRLRYLKDPNMFQAYVFGKKRTLSNIATRGAKRTNHFDLVNILLDMNRRLTRRSIKKVTDIDVETIDRLLSNIPDIIMSEPSKMLTKKILIARRDKLIELRR